MHFFWYKVWLQLNMYIHTYVSLCMADYAFMYTHVCHIARCNSQNKDNVWAYVNCSNQDRQTKRVTKTDIINAICIDAATYALNFTTRST